MGGDHEGRALGLAMAAIALWGALWIALASFAYAIFALLAPPLGVAGAAALTGAIEARLALGQIYEAKGEIEEAVIHYVEAVKILSARKDYGGAQELLDRVLEALDLEDHRLAERAHGVGQRRGVAAFSHDAEGLARDVLLPHESVSHVKTAIVLDTLKDSTALPLDYLD